jgi:murein DD-endopeptidase MepM/ murein hydrolase activator NlpD
MNFLNYVFFTLFSVSAAAQTDTIPAYPKGYFGSPLDIPFLLAGNFGEPRASHFHMGIDIRTQEKEGLNVYAIGDGYVSRIGVSPYGYGNALYITYPNGFTSVYGHLQRFIPAITALVRKEQYAKEEFAVDFTLKPGEFPVHKGELVAYSGNTGGSGGPHLHFEMRDAMERTINPFNFGYTSADHIEPLIGAVKFYPMDGTKYTAEGYRVPALHTDSGYIFKTGLQKLNATSVGIAVNTFDKMDERLHSVGLYDLKEFDGDSLVFEYTVDRIPFDYIRYVITQIDYPIFMKEGSRAFQKCFVEHNNTMPAFYHHLKNKGIINISDGVIHRIRIEATDYAGNKSILKALIQYDPKAIAFKDKPSHYMLGLSPDGENVINGDGFTVVIPGKSLHDSVFIDYSSTPPTTPGVFSNIIKIGTSYDLLGYYTLSIKAQNLPVALKDKALIVWKSAAGGTAARGGKWDGDKLTAQAREFGTFYITIDTTPPKITPINILKGKNMHAAKNIAVSIRDNLSGISDYHGYIDGKWQLMELDGKTSVLRMALPSDLSAGEHNFKLIVTDDRNNTAEYSVTFIY